jgi:hypothetical protein
MNALIITNDQFEELLTKISRIESALIGKTASSPDQVLTNQEFLDKMNISKRTAQTWRDEGKISFSQEGGKIYYRMSDVQKFLDKTSHKAFRK